MDQVWLFPQKQRDNYLRPLPHNFISVYERLYRERTVILAAQSNYRRQMWQTVPSLLELYDSKSKDPIRVFIDAPSLGAQESLVLSKILQVSPVEVYTTLIGPVGLGPALILAGGTQGKRVAFPNSKISFDTTGLPLDTASIDPSCGNYFSVLYKKLQDRRELVRRFLSICAERSSSSEYELLSTMESKSFLSPREAINFGIIDDVVNIREDNENRILDTFNPGCAYSNNPYDSRFYLF
jgi:ATP-dependent Clp protease protease subunit